MRYVIALLLTTGSALAQTTVVTVPVIPSEEDKKSALMRAYQANGNSMVGWSSFDATEPRPIKTERIIPLSKKK